MPFHALTLSYKSNFVKRKKSERLKTVVWVEDLGLRAIGHSLDSRIFKRIKKHLLMSSIESVSVFSSFLVFDRQLCVVQLIKICTCYLETECTHCTWYLSVCLDVKVLKKAQWAPNGSDFLFLLRADRWPFAMVRLSRFLSSVEWNGPFYFFFGR